MNKKIKLILSLLVVLLFVLLFNTKVHAASASISASSTNVTVGSEVKITTTINAAAWNVHLTGSVSADYVGYTPDTEDTTKVETKTFKPTSAGTYTVNLSGDVSGSENSSSTSVSKSITINVVEKTSDNNLADNGTGGQNGTTSSNGGTTGGQNVSEPTRDNGTTTTSSKSNNANLSNLGITPNDFKGFKPATTSYNVTVPNNVEKVTVYATQSDSKATVSGTGARKLEVGKNAITVTVTAEDGTQKTYTINVTREEEKVADNTTNNTVDDKTVNETTENTVSEDNTVTTGTTNSDLVTLDVAGFTLTPKFSPDVFEYKIKVNEDVNDLEVKTEGASENVDIEVAGNTSLQDGENVITILVYNKETSKTTTYQIIVEKTKMEIEEVNYNDAIQKAAKIRRITLGVVLFIVVCIIIFIIAKKRLNPDSGEDLYEYDEEDEEKLDLDEEEEFFNRVNKNKLKKVEEIEEEKENVHENNITESIHKQGYKFEQEMKDDDEEEEKTEFFRTSKSSKKGKHF